MNNLECILLGLFVYVLGFAYVPLALGFLFRLCDKRIDTDELPYLAILSPLSAPIITVFILLALVFKGLSYVFHYCIKEPYQDRFGDDSSPIELLYKIGRG